MAETSSKIHFFLFARLVIVRLIAFAAVGWEQLIARPTGPMAFRFILQPIMAASAALRDGIDDTTSWRSPYFRALLTNPFERGHRLYEALTSPALAFPLFVAVRLDHSHCALAAYRGVWGKTVMRGQLP
jgi:hypothetical protein